MALASHRRTIILLCIMVWRIGTLRPAQVSQNPLICSHQGNNASERKGAFTAPFWLFPLRYWIFEIVVHGDICEIRWAMGCATFHRITYSGCNMLTHLGVFSYDLFIRSLCSFVITVDATSSSLECSEIRSLRCCQTSL